MSDEPKREPGALEALQRVEAFMAQRRRLLVEVARTDDDMRPIATNGPEGAAISGLRLEAADVYALMTWADRGINAAFEEADAELKREGEEPEDEEMMVLVIDGLPVILPLEIPGDSKPAGGVESAVNTAKRFAATGSASTVIVVPKSCVTGGQHFRREVITESLGAILGSQRVNQKGRERG